MAQSHVAIGSEATPPRVARRQSPSGVGRGRVDQWALLADAAHQGVVVAVNERLGRRQGWRVIVRLSDAWFSADVDSADALRPVADLLTGHSPAAGPVPLGRWNRSPVVLIRDDEFADRAFVLIGSPAGPVVRFTFAGDTFGGLAASMQAVVDQLGSE